MANFQKTSLNKVRRLPERGRYDRDTIYQIVDEALICHIGFIVEDRPFVIPTIHARQGDFLFMHGSKSSRMLNSIEQGIPLCVTVTLLDGIVFARSVFHHSMNYRSAVLYGSGCVIKDEGEKVEALRILTEHIAAGRWKDTRPPSRKELLATKVIKMKIESASAKVRTGPPSDDPDDYGLPVWAGVLPLSLQPSSPMDDATMVAGVSRPTYVEDYHRP